MGVTNILAFDVQAERRTEVEEKFGLRTIGVLDEAWADNPSVALVATPTNLHVPLALVAAQHDCHLFIEKPLGDNLVGTDDLVSEVLERKLKTMVGCNMRFHHGPATIKKLVDEEAVGRIISVRMDAGFYLPDWHPFEDYRNGYSANAAMGGGVILDGIHEIDYARWMFGEINQVYCQGGTRSSLEIDTEDTVDILMKVDAGFSVALHMDYVQRAYCRTCKVIGEDGTLFWDMNQGEVKLFSGRAKSWRSFSAPADYNVNQMYLDEMAHFLAALRGEHDPVSQVPEAKRVLQITLSVKDSMISGEPIQQVFRPQI